MYDLSIVGAGYWGISMALMAEEAGMSVCIIDSKNSHSGSRNAGGHFSLEWFSGEFREHMELALEDAERLGFKVDRSGAKINTISERNKNGKGSFKEKPDWWTFNPSETLSLRGIDVVGEVVGISGKNKRAIVCTDEDDVWSRNIVVCAGAWTDHILTNSGYPGVGVSALRGSAVSFKGEHREKVLLHQTTPYRQVSLRNWGEGRIRVGETTETGTKPTSTYVDKMLKTVGHWLGPDDVPVRCYTGFRAMRKSPFAGMVGDKVYAATGGGRNGGLMGFWAARKILGELCG